MLIRIDASTFTILKVVDELNFTIKKSNTISIFFNRVFNLLD